MSESGHPQTVRRHPERVNRWFFVRAWIRSYFCEGSGKARRLWQQLQFSILGWRIRTHAAKWVGVALLSLAIVAGAFLLGRVVLPDDAAARQEGYAEGTRNAHAAQESHSELGRQADSASAGRYAALTLDLWRTFSSMEVSIEAPNSFVGGVPAAAASLRNDIATVENLSDQIAAVDLTGHKFEVQRDIYVDGARLCLDTASSIAQALEAGQLDVAKSLHGPLIDCYLRWQSRAAHVAYQ